MTRRIAAWTIAVVATFGLTACSGAPSDEAESAPAVVATEAATTAPEPETQAGTPAQENALRKAQDYLKMTGFSYEGLIQQLEFEQFSAEDATWAADHVGADWNEQAVRKGEEYLKLSGFSWQGLVDQLVFEKFTSEQAEHAATTLGL